MVGSGVGVGVSHMICAMMKMVAMVDKVRIKMAFDWKTDLKMKPQSKAGTCSRGGRGGRVGEKGLG